MSVRSWKLPGRAALPLKLIGGVSTVKDQREPRPERPEAGVRNHDPAAMATQKTPRAQPMTLVQDQSRLARPHLQPASKTASMTSPIVRSPRGVAQVNPRDDPRSAAAISNSQTSRPPVSQTSSPRLPCLPPERARIGGPTRARQPASVERLDSRASGGQVSRPLWISRLKPQPSAAVSRIALVTACSGELAAPGELLARLVLMGSDVVPRKWSRNTPGRDGNASPIRRCVGTFFLRSIPPETIIPRCGVPTAGAIQPAQSNRSMLSIVAWQR